MLIPRGGLGAGVLGRGREEAGSPSQTWCPGQVPAHSPLSGRWGTQTWTSPPECWASLWGPVVPVCLDPPSLCAAPPGFALSPVCPLSQQRPHLETPIKINGTTGPGPGRAGVSTLAPNWVNKHGRPHTRIGEPENWPLPGPAPGDTGNGKAAAGHRQRSGGAVGHSVQRCAEQGGVVRGQGRSPAAGAEGQRPVRPSTPGRRPSASCPGPLPCRGCPDPAQSSCSHPPPCSQAQVRPDGQPRATGSGVYPKGSPKPKQFRLQ